MNSSWLLLTTFVLIFFLPMALRAGLLLYEYGLTAMNLLASLRSMGQVKAPTQNEQTKAPARNEPPAWSYPAIFDVTGMANWINWALIFSHTHTLLAVLQLAVAYLEPVIWIWKTPALAWAGALPTVRKAAMLGWTALWLLFILFAFLGMKYLS